MKLDDQVSDGQTLPRTMKAMVQYRYGSADVLHLEDRALPTFRTKDVLVRVQAAGVDRGVLHMMTGTPYLGRLAFGVRRPRNPVPGMDLAGTVVAAGSEVTHLKPGDEVFGSGKGTYAEYATASSDMVSLKPAALSFAQAAAIPVSAVTALQGLRKAGRIEPGQQVLITGASGGVGSYAIQMAKALGAEVTGLSSAGKFDFVRSLGADHLIDYRKTGFPRASRRYDVILDIAGNPSLRSLRSALTQNGTAVIAGGEEGGTLTGGIGRQLGAVVLSPFIRQRLAMFLGLVRAADLEELARMIDDGQLVPALDRTFPLDQAQLALRSLEAGEVRGKVAITL